MIIILSLLLKMMSDDKHQRHLILATKIIYKKGVCVCFIGDDEIECVVRERIYTQKG